MRTNTTGLTGWRRWAINSHAWLPYYPGKWRVGCALARACTSRLPGVAEFRRRGVSYRVDPRVVIAQALLLYGVWEQAETRFLKRRLRPGMVAADVGANLGYYTLLCSRLVGPAGRVYAFEPTPRTFATLEENVRLNACTNVEARNCAAGSEPGRLRLVESELVTGSITNHIALDPGDTEVITLDSLELPRLDFLKVDVEGFDLRVLRGAQGTLRRCRPVVLVEVNTDGLARCGDTPQELLEFLQALGYELRRPTWHGLRAFEEPSPGDYRNAVALPRRAPRTPDQEPSKNPQIAG